ncbi:MAG: family 78 glycoside hydrolase catalytic domain, partial [Phycisphaerales bacterium]
SQDVFARNIVFTDYRPIRVNKPWGKECDWNLLHKPGQTQPSPAVTLRRASGLDTHSIEADAMFLDPAHGDYRIRSESPALALGFRNFPMDQFGVQSPSLKAIARAPKLPDAAGSEPTSTRDARVVEWLGAKVRNVVGLGEVSAAGLPGEVGVAVLDVPLQSQVARSGLQVGDVILKCADTKVDSLDDLIRVHRGIPAGKDATLEVFRNQQRIQLPVPERGARDEMTAVELRCEYAVDPLGIDASAPRLFWKLRSNVRGQRQTAYQVLVASSPGLLAEDNGDLWDSGKMVSEETIHIAYGGKPLRSSQQVFWKVRIWDKDGVQSAWSTPASWTMGVLDSQDWRAKWIMRGTGAVDGGGLPLFRKSFDLARPVSRAVVHVCGLGHYDLFLDGRKVGDRFLDPAWSVYGKTVYYSTFDITDALREGGSHTLGVMLGKGFYNTVGDRRVHGVNADRPLKLILQTHLWFADGSEEFIVSDGSWKTAEGPITHSAILGGEDYDARRLPAKWDRQGFDDASWAAAVETEGPGGRLVASCAPVMRMYDVFTPVRIDEPQPGVFVYDFGQNASAVPRLCVRGQAGQVLKLTPAEQRHGMSPRRNDGTGLVNPAGVGNPNYWQYTLRGDGEERWTPQFAYSGFQYLQLEDAVPAGRPNPEGKPVVEELVSMHVRNDAPSVGRFECSDPLFNDIDRIIDWAVRSNMAHVLTDCPHREKLGWLEVSYLMGPSISGRYDIASFYSKVTQDCADSQKPDGMVPTVAPAYPAFSGGFAYTPEWGAAAVVLPWQLYEWYGDKEVLAARYSTMKRFVDYMRETSRDLVPAPGLGDWYDYGHDKPRGAAQFTPVELTAMATFFRCARIVADAARVLDRRDDQAAYEKLATDIAEAFNKRYFDGVDQYTNHGSPQTANSMALALGLAPTGLEQAVLERVIEDIHKRGNQQTSGDIGFWYLLQALAQQGRSDVIHDTTARTDIGSYGFIVRNGWTSMPEAWDADTGASMNHCMLGHIQEWFLGWVAGIRPDVASPGFRRFIIDPHPVGNLTWARAHYDSIRGEITSDWRKSAGVFTLNVTIPPNTSAIVCVPTGKAEDVTESGTPAMQGAGIRLLDRERKKVRFLVDAGTYEFAMREGE